MADDSTNKTIRSTDSGFPGYLDFEKLRSEAIAYLGNLSGKIWTDYNVHDPGITILEALIYAILDLGYRTNLPAIDLFTKNPEDKSADNNFFTPAQIFANNPLTITDFRKLLIDIKGVKNAWIETEDKLPTHFCNNSSNINNSLRELAANLKDDPTTNSDFINGLYHVFIELEKDYNLKKSIDADEYNDVISHIKCALMSHRNLCEDFIDIKILCKLKIGLCADIELDNTAVGEEVYSNILEVLHNFFSPAPQFYTLPQLLEKGKPIENIFAGRPYNVKESYGFVDVGELEQIQLRKKMHLSDVYHVLFDIEGIKNVRNLDWNLCNNDGPQPDINNKWEMVLPENFIPEFDVNCSGFQFFRYGMQIKLDSSKAISILAMKYSSNGKIPYKQPSIYLDSVIPQGVYRNDLADYSSIQNDFPHVYGIKKGDLSANASEQRKAQALQLQGFLLFFDQLLANYLSQLKSIRSLFAMSSSKNEEENQTYFTNNLTDVPQLEKLLRFHSNTDGSESIGSDGTTLAFPTERKNLEDLITTGKIQQTDLDRRCNDVNKDDFPPYQFCYKSNLKQAENQLRNDLLQGSFEPVIVANYNNCYFFYCITSSPDFALISKKYYSNEQEAQTAAASIKYLATFEENYRTFLIENNNSSIQYFSFDLEFNLNSYPQFLKLMSEDPLLYNNRRQEFLNHLLSRFAEQFSDYALLTSGFVSPDKLKKGQINAEEKFLSNYPDLSSNRGKGYDYKCNGWNNENISGFEKRVKALGGIDNWKKHYLCNFVVEKADEIYKLSISLFGSSFTVEHKVFTKEAGYSSISSLFKILGNKPVLQAEFMSHENKWNVFIKDGFGNKFINQNSFNTQDEAKNYINSSNSILSEKPDINQKVDVSQFVYKILFKNYKDDLIEESKDKFNSKEDALKYFNKISPKVSNYLNNSRDFSKIKKGLILTKLTALKNKNDTIQYIDKDKFEFKPIDVIQLGNVKKKFALLNDANTLQFDSLIIVDTVKIAESKFDELVRLLTSKENYNILKENGGNNFKILIKNADVDTAVYFQTFDTEEEAEVKIIEIFNEIISHTYHLSISEPVADKWEFEYQLTNPSGNNIQFKTKAGYISENQAKAAAKKFYRHITSLQIKKVKNNLQLSLNHKKQIIAQSTLPLELPDEEMPAQLLQYHKDFAKMVNNPTKKSIEEILEAGKDSNANKYVYKLVDKDKMLAKASFASKDLETTLKYKNELIDLIQTGYDYTTLSFGSESIKERKDAATNVSWYHYQVKCNNFLYQKGSYKGMPLILFESVKGYESRDDAAQAFRNNYLLILRKAFSEYNYGVNQFISLTEILIHEADDCRKDLSSVFIIPETLYEFNGDTVAAIKAIILLAKSYPIVYISEGRYCFSLFNKKIIPDKNNIRYNWRSTENYETLQEANRQFQFFLTLLKYSGNFYIEKSETDCRYRIYIREVLALSASSFSTPSDAWGEKGVEKFICTTQSERGFHNYFNQNNCAHSFYVACGNTGLVHPCKYETPERRNNALEKLHSAASFNFFDFLEVDDNNNVSLLGMDRKPIAKLFIPTMETNQLDKCAKLIEIFEGIYIDKYFDHPKSEGVFLNNNKEERIAEPISANITSKDWKQQLREVACYFPLIKQVNETSDSNNTKENCNFYIQIKLRDFNPCKDDLASNCVDTDSEENCQPGCEVAWKSECCFNSCCNALLFYESSLQFINDLSNYKEVYECDCGYYGIELHTPQLVRSDQIKPHSSGDRFSNFGKWLCKDAQTPKASVLNFEAEENLVNNTVVTNECLSEIVAVNPQQYNNASIACEAVERSKKLINSEGLHLVEHILLRPRCVEDCECKNLPSPCDKGFGSNVIDNLDAIDNPNPKNNICQFLWIPGGDRDPCAPEVPIQFTPGYDPYSFIATIALPAWPQRFQSKESRALVEKLLQKEAPAHVLLRILWLSPRDFCCFEYYFKKWNFWLAKKMCDAKYNNCEFLGLLFHKEFDTLWNCVECVPCGRNDKPEDSCFAEEEKNDDCLQFDLVEQLNNLYCWNDGMHIAYNCENDFEKTDLDPVTKPKVIAKATKISQTTSSLKSTIANELDTSVTVAKLPDAKVNFPVVDEHEKSLILQARSAGYNANVLKIVKTNEGNKTAENALRFLSDINPDAKRYDDLVNKILKNKPDKTKNIKGLTLKDKNVLIHNISWQYFDRIIINNKNTVQITGLSALFNHLRKNKINLHLLYDDWDSAELKSVAPEINFNEIRKAVI